MVTELFDEKKSVIAKEGGHRMESARSNLLESPIYLPLGRDGLEHSPGILETGVTSNCVPSMSLRMIVRDTRDENLLKKVTDWLWKSALRDVLGIDILDITERAKFLANSVMAFL